MAIVVQEVKKPSFHRVGKYWGVQDLETQWFQQVGADTTRLFLPEEYTNLLPPSTLPKGL